MKMFLCTVCFVKKLQCRERRKMSILMSSSNAFVRDFPDYAGANDVQKVPRQSTRQKSSIFIFSFKPMFNGTISLRQWQVFLIARHETFTRWFQIRPKWKSFLPVSHCHLGRKLFLSTGWSTTPMRISIIKKWNYFFLVFIGVSTFSFFHVRFCVEKSISVQIKN